MIGRTWDEEKIFITRSEARPLHRCVCVCLCVWPFFVGASCTSADTLDSDSSQKIGSSFFMNRNQRSWDATIFVRGQKWKLVFSMCDLWKPRSQSWCCSFSNVELCIDLEHVAQSRRDTRLFWVSISHCKPCHTHVPLKYRRAVKEELTTEGPHTLVYSFRQECFNYIQTSVRMTMCIRRLHCCVIML